MTKLLVSVRNAEEAEVALVGGADVIDVKEPRRGPLGPADPAVWREILSVVRNSAITSAALGELLHDAVATLAVQATGFTFAKIGLAGCKVQQNWKPEWDRAVEVLPQDVLPVPVAYADLLSAHSPEPRELLKLAADSPAKLLLIDTFNKSNGRLTDYLNSQALTSLLNEAEALDVQLALAGSLQLGDVENLLPLEPAYIGVRGAACNGGRDGTIDLARVKSLANLIRRSAQNQASCCLTTTSATPILPCR
jgi:uncharacterized protein (UPF0264 family)